MSEVTEILQAIDHGDPKAADQLLPLLYDELRNLAAARLRNEPAGQTIQATILVHEAWLRLVGNTEDGSESSWSNRAHFFGAAAEAMRRILVDRARAKQALKRGGDLKRVEFEAIDHPATRRPDELLAIHEAIAQLEELDPRKADVVKLRFFAGLTNAEAAKIVRISDSTAERYWSFSRAWLRVRLEESLPTRSRLM